MRNETWETLSGIEFAHGTALAATAVGTGETLLALRSQPVEWFGKCMQRLRELAALDANWDSYGAAPVNEVSIHYAQRFLAILVLVQAVERPIITATPNGNVAFAWGDHERSMDLEIDDRGQISYYYEKGGDEREGLTTNSLAAIELLTRV